MNKKGIWHWLIVGILIALAVFEIGAAGKLSFYGDTVKFKYTQDKDSDVLRIGDKDFIASDPQFVCDYQGKLEYRAPDPAPYCWKVPVEYEGKFLYLYPGQSIQISSALSVELKLNTKMEFGEDHVKIVDDHWQSVFTFSADTSEALYTEPVQVPSTVILGSDSDALLEINNNIASFDQKHAGLWIRKGHSLLERGEPLETVEFELSVGTNKYLIPLDTSELGEVKIEVQPFVTVKADSISTIYQKNPYTISYTVVLDYPTSDETDAIVSEMSFLDKIIAWFMGWFD